MVCDCDSSGSSFLLSVLVPVQVTAIISHAEPYMHSAKKRARRLSVAATDYVRRHSFGPVPLKDHEK